MFINEDHSAGRPLIVTLSGKARNGKDYVANLLKDELEKHGKRVCIAHYADELKFICKQFYGWNGEKDEVGRALLQYVGTEIYRAKDLHFWVKRLISIFGSTSSQDVLKVKDFEWRQPDVILIPDTRFPNEILGWVACGYTVVPLAVLRMDKVFVAGKNGEHGAEPETNTWRELVEAIHDGTVTLTPFVNDLDSTALRHASETALDPFVFNVDGKGVNPKIRICSDDHYDGKDEVTTDLDSDENSMYVRTASMYFQMETPQAFTSSVWRTSELNLISFEDHFNTIFKSFIERNMRIVTNVSGVKDVAMEDVKTVASGICSKILDKAKRG